MNNTNRFANRFLLLIAGLVTLILGAAAIGLAAVAPFADRWDETAPEVLTDIETRLQATPITQSGPSWITAGALALLVLAVVVLAIFIFRQGRGQTSRLVVSRTGDDGTTIIDTAVAADILHEALSRQPELIASHVSAYSVRRTPVLDVTVTCRRGASPRAVSDMVNNSLDDLNALVGAEIPALVHIGGGLRTRLTAPQRLDIPTAAGADPRRPQLTTNREETPSWDSSASSSSA